jgi:hypothetical protein
MRLWVTEVGKDTVPHVFRNEPTALGDLLGAAAVVRADDLSHVLGVEARRQSGGSDEIAEHDRKLAALRRCLGLKRRMRDSGGHWPCRGLGLNCRELLPTL